MDSKGNVMKSGSDVSPVMAEDRIGAQGYRM